MKTRRSTIRHQSARNVKRGIDRFLKVGLMFAGLWAALGFGYLGAYVWKQLRSIPDISILEKYEPIEAVQLFDRNDQLICSVEGDEDRRVVPLRQVSNQMQQAMLAAEDHHFYEHHGINIVSILRAMLVNLQAGHVVEGGSTITQQLVKNLFFENGSRTFDRKIKEAVMAFELERRYTKDRILELYLNQVYFGNNAYGIERAAWRYFDKPAAGLDLAQSAFLAGLVKAPSEMSSPQNRDVAITRQREILEKMVEYGYITTEQGQQARKEGLIFRKSANPLSKYPYYVSYVLQMLHDRFSQSEMRKQGLRVYTNLDPMAQELAEKTLTEDIHKAPKGVTQGALVSVSVPDGAVIALVGGVGDFWKNQWNRATNPHTCGSSFKPFVYLTAFRKAILTPDSLIPDEPLTIKQPWGLPDYSPKNFDRRFLGKIPVRKALALSRNVCSVRIGQMVGIENVVETARLAGITAKLDPNLSLCLGSSAVSPLEMAGAYATFARGGVCIRPQVLRRIENNKGQVVEVFEPRVEKVFEEEPVAELLECMQGVVKFGTGTQARLKDRPVAGKTGTADESKDIWFLGFTPDLVTAVWGGNDENLPIPGSHVTGGDVMAKIWRDYNQAYYQKRPTAAGSFLSPTKPQEELAKPSQGDSPSRDANLAPAQVLPAPELGTAVPRATYSGPQPLMFMPPNRVVMPPVAPDLSLRRPGGLDADMPVPAPERVYRPLASPPDTGYVPRRAYLVPSPQRVQPVVPNPVFNSPSGLSGNGYSGYSAPPLVPGRKTEATQPSSKSPLPPSRVTTDYY